MRRVYTGSFLADCRCCLRPEAAPSGCTQEGARRCRWAGQARAAGGQLPQAGTCRQDGHAGGKQVHTGAPVGVGPAGPVRVHCRHRHDRGRAAGRHAAGIRPGVPCSAWVRPEQAPRPAWVACSPAHQCASQTAPSHTAVCCDTCPAPVITCRGDHSEQPPLDQAINSRIHRCAEGAFDRHVHHCRRRVVQSHPLQPLQGASPPPAAHCDSRLAGLDAACCA